MCRNVIFFVVAVLVTFSQTAQIPSYFTKCKKSDSGVGECVKKSANAGLNEFANGDKKYQLLSLRPLIVPYMRIDTGDLAINGTNVVITGFDSTVITDAKVDFDKKHFSFTMELKNDLMVKGRYDMSGRILILAVKGNGDLELTFKKMKDNLSFDYDLQKIDGKEYIVPKNMKFTTDIPEGRVHLDNLFNGNKILGDNMNEFMNENWQDVHSELAKPICDALGEVFQQYLTNFFKIVPFSELFDD